MNKLFQGFKQVHAHSSSNIIEVVLASTYNGTDNSEIDIFYDLLHDFEDSYKYHLSRRNFRKLETNINGLPMAKFGLKSVNCKDLLEFLKGIRRPRKYHLKYASVKCGGLSFPLCMVPPCDPQKYKS
ncbi:hypothetical protein OESDEN_05035 [Oesophagostomum dentatum]|uniref:Uncharacterized protein n=1 Tax=Oesophagostomum dentatum TaxID=61180 RepID=A0A0B1THY7_OESDE|nr:hypothetical protein OESDEN_05035 [Oesophagostomum dentatum]